MTDNRYMTRAIELAQMAVGFTSPNPPVGAVLVKNDQIIGEGFTLPAGQDHAEVVAIKSAASGTSGSELYVTLEPCNHIGKTPPCTEAIIAAGVDRVNIALMDPAPHTSGQGVERLKSAGIEVSLFPPTQKVLELVEAFAKYINTRIPFVIAKFAMSLDGKIATRSGESQWISNELSRNYAHTLRSKCDAIMVGIGTVIKDNPRLTARMKDSQTTRYPLRVILDSSGRLPKSSVLLREYGQNLVIVSSDEAANRINSMGVDVLVAPSIEDGLDIAFILEELGNRGILSILVEGGAGVLGTIFERQLADKVVAFIAPKIIGGIDAPSPVQGQGVNFLAEAINLDRVQVTELNGDIMMVGYK